MSTTRAYQSSNGDTWDLVRDEAGHSTHVRHTPTLSSGGRSSDVALEAFLSIEPHSPQHRAVTALIAAPVAERQSEHAPRVRGYVHDPKEPGGPYIAVILAGAEPIVSLHKSYADAERELERGLADPKQTSLSHRYRSTDPKLTDSSE